MASLPAGAVVGLVLAPQAALTAWLAAMVGWSEVPIGCLAILMMVALVSGAWRPLFEDPLTAGAALLPLTALLFVPVLVGLWLIYPWADPQVATTLPAFKGTWLSPVFFIVRTLFYFAVLIGLQQALLRTTGEARLAVAAAGLIAYALIGSLLGVDWMESIQPRFHSSIYGLIAMTGQWLGGLSFAILLAMRTARGRDSFVAGGCFVVALLMWAYIQAMQYIVIWSADIPREAGWYLIRDANGWQIVTWTIVFAQGVLPFLALLSPRTRGSARAMTAIAAVTIAMRLIEAAWLVLPPTGLAALPTGLLLIAAWAAIGGLGTATFLRLARRHEADAARPQFQERRV